MRKIHVLTRKEEIDPAKIVDCTAVIIDVLLATTTIAATLCHGAKEVIPVMDYEEAYKIANTLSNDSFIFSGESGGYRMDGFLNPDPVELIQLNLTGKTMIFSTTNGTVAIKKSIHAKKVITSSLNNGKAVARKLIEEQDESTILIICGGSHSRFAIEDFLGAGYLISELLKNDISSWTLTDSARTAFQLYTSQANNIEKTIAQSETARFISTFGYKEAIWYAAQKGILDVVPVLEEGRLIVKT